MMKSFLLLITLFIMVFAEDECSKKEEQLKVLETQRSSENVAHVLSWLTLTKATSSNKKILINAFKY